MVTDTSTVVVERPLAAVSTHLLGYLEAQVAPVRASIEKQGGTITVRRIDDLTCELLQDVPGVVTATITYRLSGTGRRTTIEMVHAFDSPYVTQESVAAAKQNPAVMAQAEAMNREFARGLAAHIDRQVEADGLGA